MNSFDAISDESFALLLFLIISFVFTIYSIEQAKRTKKFIDKLAKSFAKRKQLRENFLLENQDTKDVFYYFLETKSLLPERLHNFMLANSVNKDFYAESYINCIDTKTKNVKKNSVETLRHFRRYHK